MVSILPAGFRRAPPVDACSRTMPGIATKTAAACARSVRQLARTGRTEGAAEPESLHAHAFSALLLSRSTSLPSAHALVLLHARRRARLEAGWAAAALR